MNTITIKTLERMPSGARACKPAREWFQKKFPNGGELAEVWNACPNWLWKVWFAMHSAPTVDAVAFAQSCAERAASYAADAIAKTTDASKAVYDADAAASAADYAAAYVEAVARAAADAVADAADYAAANADAAADAADAVADAASRTFAAAAAADCSAVEVQAQVAWAKRILFSAGGKWT